MINFTFGIIENLLILGVPTLKHITVCLYFILLGALVCQINHKLTYAGVPHCVKEVPYFLCRQQKLRYSIVDTAYVYL